MIGNRGKDRLMWQVLFLFFGMAMAPSTFGQGSKINCLMPYEIKLAREKEAGVKNVMVEYEHHDDHTFWYRIEALDNLKIEYEVSSLDNQKNFDIYFYQYDGTNFCRSFIQNNLDLISFEKKLEYKLEKGSDYYLGIFPLFPGGCGHKIRIENGESLFEIESKNMHRSCASDDIVSNPEPTDDKGDVVISGKVMDAETGSGINARLTLIDPFTAHEQRIFSDDDDGFRIWLLEDGDYKLRIQSFGYKDLITALSAYDGEYYSYELEASPERNYVLENVYFYPNTFALKDESKEELEGVYSFLVNHPRLQIEVVGHTNGDKDVKASRFVKEKSPEWNFNGTAKDLSLQRAEKIKSYLVEEGIDDIRIHTIGMGGAEMIIDNPSNMKEAMQNIRVEILISTQN